MLVKRCFFDRAAANQLAMFLLLPLPRPALLKDSSGDSYWTSIQMLQCALPLCFDCTGGRYLIRQSEILEFEFNRDVLPATINEIAASIFFGKGPKEALNFFDVLQPLLMESIFADGFSVSLQDFSISRATKRIINSSFGVEKVKSLLYQLRSIYNELVAQQLEKQIRDIELPIINFALKSTKLGDLIDSKSKSAIDKVVQQIGFLGQQLFERGRFYSKGLVEDVASHFHVKCFYDEDDYPSAKYGLLKGCFFNGLDPYEEMVHSISTREIMVRSSRGLSEPGTLFKNLMAILRDVVICYDGTVRNVCSNSIIQFEYGMQAGVKTEHLFPAGEPVGVLAATAMSNPAYKAVLDASPSSNSSWELMKEILLCKVNFRNEPVDRRVILYLNDCDCGRRYCREHAAYLVKNQLRKVSLKDAAEEFIIEYQQQRTRKDNSKADAGLVGHIYLYKRVLEELKINMASIFQKCLERLDSLSPKKKVNQFLKNTQLSFSESCSSPYPTAPCLSFWLDDRDRDLDATIWVLSDKICAVLLETVIQGDPRISSASIIWVSPDTNTWVRNPYKSSNGELALDIMLEKEAVKQSGDAWRIVIDSCLPVLHLIDTSRSVPYAIKQIQELMGISCTFDQVIQRVSASVKMVAKGVLREHLILLASSMTCGGNLVGFNMSGYKALARQLNIQVPFTEATLFTPKKCFERAAEKCHTDSLSSIVASCSWGKHVAVGTGSKFDVVWDTHQIKSNEIEGMNVYNFLHMVKSLTDGEEQTDACLGEDIDYLLEEDMDLSMSPQHTSGAVFEENLESLDVSTASVWDANKKQTESKTNEWSGWGSNKTEIKDSRSERAQEDCWRKTDAIAEDSSGFAWDANTTAVKTTIESSEWSAWGRKTDVVQEDSSRSMAWDTETTADKTNAKSNEWSSWGNKSEIPASGFEIVQKKSWGSSKSKADVTQEDSSRSGGWNADAAVQTKTKSNELSGWGRNKSDIPAGSSQNVQDSWGSGKRKADVTQEDNFVSGAWGSNTTDQTTKSNEWSSWGSKKSEVAAGGSQNLHDSWGSSKRKDDIAQKDNSGSGGWDANRIEQNKTKSNEWSGWGSKKSEVAAGGSQNLQDSWGSSKRKDDIAQKDNSGSGGWDANRIEQNKKSNEWSGWGSKKSEVPAGASENVQEDSWGSVKQKDNVTQKYNSESGGWDVNRTEHNKTKSNEWSGWGKKSEVPAGASENVQDDSWGSGKWKDDVSLKDNSGSGAWGATKTSQTNTGLDGESEKAQEDAWGSGGWKDESKVGNSSWGKPKSSESQAWGSQNQSNQNASSQGWESHIASANSDSEKSFQWGKQGRESFKKNRFEGSQGRGSNAGDWKNRNRPPRAPGQRLDIYSPEEQDILKVIEPIMQSIRRIMQQQGYTDGDPLAAEDQHFVLENVFEHHPDKETKMGAGIDYVMVNKHSSFQDSRCLYVVLKDGRQEDFSYRKCLDNFIRKKYPDHAESFVGKYFRKPRARVEQASTQGQDGAATLGDQTSMPGPVETNE